jgi:hypothetical protein
MIVFQFFAARSFNRDIVQWDVSKVTNMRQMVRKKKVGGDATTLVRRAGQKLLTQLTPQPLSPPSFASPLRSIAILVRGMSEW